MPALLAARGARATLVAMSVGSEQHDGAQALAKGLEHFREVRRELEESVLPLATSLDGRRFTFQASLHGLELRLGGYVVVEQAGVAARLGQVLDLELAHAGGAELNVSGPDESDGVLRA